MPSTLKFNTQFSCIYGKSEQLSPLIRRVVANNPGPYTFYGTGTYIIGQKEVAVIDPGPADEQHIKAILSATHNETITHILITHTHRDHSSAAMRLKQLTGAKIYGYPASAIEDETIQMDESFDLTCQLDIEVDHGTLIHGSNWNMECLHTPGHTSNHLCFQLREENTLFCGDHIMAWSTTVISPPNGNLNQYLDSLKFLLTRSEKR